MKLPRIVVFNTIAAVVLAAGAQTQPTGPLYRIDEDLRLDAGTENFSRIRYLYVGPRKEIVVTQIQDLQLLVYDSLGKRVATVGRRGSGPGEFQMILPVGWKADTMWVGDELQRRLSYFAADTQLIRSVSNGLFRGPSATLSSADRAAGRRLPTPAINPIAVLPDGSIIGYQERREASSGRDAVTYIPTMVLQLFSPAGRDKEIEVLPPTSEERWRMRFGSLYRPVPLSPNTLFAISAYGDRAAHATARLTSARSGSIAVTAFRTTGERLFVRTFPYAGVSIPARVRDSAIAAIRPRSSAMDGGGAEVVDAFQKMARERMPEVYPGVTSLTVGIDDTFWLGLPPSAAGNPYVALDLKGDPVASVVLPPRARLMQASRSRIWAVETDEDGLLSVVRFRLTAVR